MPYAALGSAPSMVNRNDPILKHSSIAANKVMAAISTLPSSRRQAETDRMLNALEPGLALKVKRVTITLERKMSSQKALRGALKLVLADWALDHFKRLGSQTQRGGQSVMGLGDVGSTILNIGQGLICGTAASAEAQALAARIAGGAATTAGMATSTGFDVARQICPGSSSAPAPSALPPASEPAPFSIPWVPILVGGTLLVGIVVFVKMRS